MAEASFEELLSSITSNPDLINRISRSVKENEGGDLSKTLGEVINLIQGSEESRQHMDNEDSNSARDNEATGQKEEREAVKEAFKENDEKSNVGLDKFIFSLGKSMSRTSPLLLALKPYLSKNRCDLIDSLINISRLASIVNLAK